MPKSARCSSDSRNWKARTDEHGPIASIYHADDQIGQFLVRYLK